jgi:predicted DNA-binding transcriptional regulator YafY
VRADRLLLLLAHLEARGRLTIARLAEELDVSRRTVLRDLYALRVAGFPVNTESGPGGGCWLEDGFRNRLLHLSRDEIAALFSLNVPSPLVELGVANDLKGALLKLSAALPSSGDGAGRRAKPRIHLDSAPWTAPADSVQHLALLHRAVLEDRWVRATFLRAHAILTSRRIAPCGLVAKAAMWYVVWAGEDERLRVDRAASIVEAELLRETFGRPAGLDLEEFWTSWCRKQEGSGRQLVVTARVSRAALDALRHAALAPEEVPDAADSHDVLRPHCIRLGFGSVEEARAQLLAYGGSVEVIEPLALRLTLADFAAQALRIYGAQRDP